MTRFSEATRQKLRGGYYTPDDVAGFLADYVTAASPEGSYLEPSCGDGQLLAAVDRKLGKDGSALGIELFESEAQIARDRTSNCCTVLTADVFEWAEHAQGELFDGIVGNPPFIRYQSFPSEYRDEAMAYMRTQGLNPNRMTNAWVPFVVLAVSALRQGGRLALVLPAELMQVGYAAELREYLVREFANLHLITFRELVFKGIQQETVLLLGEKGRGSGCYMSVSHLNSSSELSGLSGEPSVSPTLELDHAREKWIQYYLDAHELALMRELEASADVPTIADYADVNVGIVTGRNQFFVLSPLEAEALGLRRSCVPLVGRSAQVRGLILTGEDWAALEQADSRCLLLQLGPVDRESLSPAAEKYIRWGEQEGFHEGYKCRIRLPNWWHVPSDWVPDAFLLRQIYDGPRIIENRAKATCTDTIHRVRVREGVSAKALAAASMNSLTFAFAEIRGRSYGGGVLELEPREAVGLPFPVLSDDLPVDELDSWAREREVEAVLEEVDRFVLKAMGITADEVQILRGAWRRLSERRLGRR